MALSEQVGAGEGSERPGRDAFPEELPLAPEACCDIDERRQRQSLLPRLWLGPWDPSLLLHRPRPHLHRGSPGHVPHLPGPPSAGLQVGPVSVSPPPHALPTQAPWPFPHVRGPVSAAGGWTDREGCCPRGAEEMSLSSAL